MEEEEVLARFIWALLLPPTLKLQLPEEKRRRRRRRKDDSVFLLWLPLVEEQVSWPCSALGKQRCCSFDIYECSTTTFCSPAVASCCSLGRCRCWAY